MITMNLWQISVQGAVLIAVITILRAIFSDKLPKKTFSALWMIAVLRLLLPFSQPSPFSVYSLISQKSAVSPIQNVDTADAVYFYEAQYINEQVVSGANGELVTDTLSVWTVVWLIGAVLSAVYFCVTYLRCRLELNTSLPIENDNGCAAEWLKEHPIKRSITIRQSDRIAAPLTYGILRPVILVPKTMVWDDNADCILLHEFTHIRRFDALTKLILTLTLCIHWFNPMVWVMYHLANRDMELSCDESVVRQIGEESKAVYARTLIKMAEKKSGYSPMFNHFSKNLIEERILAIMKMKKLSKKLSAILTLSAVVMTAGVTMVFATSAETNTQAVNDELPVMEEDWEGWYPLSAVNFEEEAELLSEYEKFGISYDEHGKMYFKDQRVRYFDDSTDLYENGILLGQSVRYDYLDMDGVVDVHVEHDADGKITGISADSDEVFAARDFKAMFENRSSAEAVVVSVVEDVYTGTVENAESTAFVSESETDYITEDTVTQTAVTVESAYEGGDSMNIAEKLSVYEAFGVAYEKLPDSFFNLYYHGENVETLIDYDPNTGIYSSYGSANGIGLVLQTVYDTNGKLIGVEEVK